MTTDKMHITHFAVNLQLSENQIIDFNLSHSEYCLYSRRGTHSNKYFTMFRLNHYTTYVASEIACFKQILKDYFNSKIKFLDISTIEVNAKEYEFITK